MAISAQCPPISVRSASSEDLSGILACLRSAFEPFRNLYTPAAFLDTVLTPETLSQRLIDMQVCVALDPVGQLVGTIACNLSSPAEGHLRGMAVLQEWQGCGLAGQLLEHAEAALSRQGCTRITLDTTEPLQRAMRFYEKHGFRRSGKITDFFGMPLIEYEKPMDPHGRPPRHHSFAG